MSTRRPHHFAARPAVEPLEGRQLMSGDGAFDKSFDLDGRVLTSTAAEGFDFAADVAVQADGKTVVAGTSGRSQFVARYTVDGSLDPTFGPRHNGIVRFAVGSASAEQRGLSVAVAPDGKIVVGGRAGESASVARLTKAGAFDATFDGDGKATFGRLGSAFDIAVQPDGKIVTVGDDEGLLDDDMVVLRLTTTGKPDPTFGTPAALTTGTPVKGRTGFKPVGFGGVDNGLALAVNTFGTPASNPHFGKIYVTGSTFKANRQMATARLTASGEFDSSFNGGGKLTRTAPGLGIEGRGIAVRPDGGAVVVAVTSDLNMIFSFTKTGTADTAFGLDGVVPVNFGPAAALNDVRIGSGNSIIVAGQTNGGDGLVARFTKTGSLDTTFGVTGRVDVDFGGDKDLFFGLAVTADGRVVAAGRGGAGDGDVAVTRLFESVPTVSLGTLDPTAAEAGRSTASLIVTRDRRLPYPTKVFLTVGGTATRPGGLTPADYTGLSFVQELSSSAVIDGGSSRGGLAPARAVPGVVTRYFVTIPANETFAVVTLTPTDDTLIEGTETATFAVAADPRYSVGASNAAAINFLDNDAPAAPASLRATADAFVRDGTSSAQNFGAEADLVVKTNAPGSRRDTYLKFDLSSVAAVNSAKLRLFGRLSTAGAVQVQAFAVPDTSWTESGITFDNRPSLAGGPLASVTLTSTTGAFFEWDLTAYLRAEKLAGRNVVSIALRSPTTTDAAAIFASDEAAANRPELLVS